ncbi:unannotated protein [freshwater metagenome]|uniref:Unannotated protein n=1 Tax=freshwater metagenome TaxID=449393 RepID=A0A6J6K3R6_9ZZZZ
MTAEEPNMEPRTIRRVLGENRFGVFAKERSPCPARDGRVSVGAKGLDGRCILGGIGVVPRSGARHSHVMSLGEVPRSPEHLSEEDQRPGSRI